MGVAGLTLDEALQQHIGEFGRGQLFHLVITSLCYISQGVRRHIMSIA